MVPNARIMSVVKADAYGHGMELAVKALGESDEFAVSSLDDVKRVRSVDTQKPITLLSSTLRPGELENLGCRQQNLHNLRYTVYDWQQLENLESCTPQEPISVWLKVDTGMGRLGFSLSQVNDVYKRLRACPAIADISLMSHFANADLPYKKANHLQLGKFAKVQEENSFSQASMLNSAGVCGFSQSAFDVVRPGVMLYGASPLSGVTAAELGLRPVMNFHSELISVKQIAAGSAIGYGGLDILEQDTQVGIVSCGYGDGYPRHAQPGTPVLVNGQRTSLLGRVSMDMIAVNLGEVQAEVGASVLLWGDGLPIEEVAAHGDTIAYELMCRIPQRVERVVI